MHNSDNKVYVKRWLHKPVKIMLNDLLVPPLYLNNECGVKLQSYVSSTYVKLNNSVQTNKLVVCKAPGSYSTS